MSAIRFIEYGTDRAKTGLVTISGCGTASGQIESDLVEARAGSGRAPSYEDVFACAVDTSASLKKRMSRYGLNIQIMAQELGEFGDITPGAVLHILWSTRHPNHNRAMDDYGHGGRFLYPWLDLEGVDENALTFELHRYIADEAARKHLPLIAASNFGFALAHIHIRHENVGVSLRVTRQRVREPARMRQRSPQGQHSSISS